MIEIKKLTAGDGEDIYEMLQEIPADENGFVNGANGKTFDEFRSWLASCVKSSEQKDIVDGWKVPQTTYWLYEDGKPVGTGKVRHFLTDALRNAGGNVGYAIRPSARGRGLGKAFLALLIEEARKIGVDEILITVHDYNMPSIRVAVANGGRVEKIENGRYYISL